MTKSNESANDGTNEFIHLFDHKMGRLIAGND